MTASQPVNNPSIVWTRFLVAFVRLLSYPMREEARYRGEAFTGWRNNLLAYLASDETTIPIAASLQALLEHRESRTAGQLMLEELDAFTAYVERLTGQPIDPEGRVSDPTITWDRPARQQEEVKEGLEVSETILESLKDLLDKLPFGVRAAIKAAIELVKIARKLF